MAKQQYVLVDGKWVPSATVGRVGYVNTDAGWVEVAGDGMTQFDVGDVGHEIQDEGTGVQPRPKLNFTGTGVTATDDPANSRTNVVIPGSPAPSPAGQPDGKHLEVKTGTYVFVNRAIVYAASPPASPADGDVWIERST